MLFESGQMKGQGAERCDSAVGGGGPATTFVRHVQFSSWSGSRRLPKSRERSAPTLIQAAPGFSYSRHSSPGQLPRLMGRLFHCVRHSVQRERGFTAAAPHVICKVFKRVCQDMPQEPHSSLPLRCRVVDTQQPEPRGSGSVPDPRGEVPDLRGAHQHE